MLSTYEKAGGGTAEVLYVSDLMELFSCGRSKASLIMDAIPHVKIGQRSAVFRMDLEDYLRDHGGVSVVWPKRKRG